MKPIVSIIAKDVPRVLLPRGSTFCDQPGAAAEARVHLLENRGLCEVLVIDDREARRVAPGERIGYRNSRAPHPGPGWAD